MPKLTFKKTIKQGMYKSFERDYTYIKLNKKQIGSIQESREDGKYYIRFAVRKEPTKEDPAPFKWITLKESFFSEKEAREKVKELENKILELDLYLF